MLYSFPSLHVLLLFGQYLWLTLLLCCVVNISLGNLVLPFLLASCYEVALSSLALNSILINHFYSEARKRSVLVIGSTVVPVDVNINKEGFFEDYGCLALQLINVTVII